MHIKINKYNIVDNHMDQCKRRVKLMEGVHYGKKKGHYYSSCCQL